MGLKSTSVEDEIASNTGGFPEPVYKGVLSEAALTYLETTDFDTPYVRATSLVVFPLSFTRYTK